MLAWRNPSEYTYTENLTYRQWAWEFVRRSEAYRDHWKRILEFWQEQDRKGLKVGDPLEFPAWLLHGGTEFGLGDHLPGPDTPAYQVPELKWRFGLELKRVRTSDLIDHPAVAVFGFNLALPIEGQIEEVVTEVRILKREYDAAGHPAVDPPSVRFEKDRWTTYLRLLDAELAGASIGEMGRVVFGATEDKRGNAKNALRKAKEFAESGYRQLLLIRDPSVPHARPEELPKVTPLVRVLLGADYGKNCAGEVMEVDALRGKWILDNIPGSRPVD